MKLRSLYWFSSLSPEVWIFLEATILAQMIRAGILQICYKWYTQAKLCSLIWVLLKLAWVSLMVSIQAVPAQFYQPISNSIRSLSGSTSKLTKTIGCWPQIKEIWKLRFWSYCCPLIKKSQFLPDSENFNSADSNDV